MREDGDNQGGKRIRHRVLNRGKSARGNTASPNSPANLEHQRFAVNPARLEAANPKP